MLHAGEPDAEGKAKIEPFLNSLIKRFNECYTPTEFLSLDEMVIGFKGRFMFLQFNMTKPAKHHIKAFGLTDSSSGYVLNLLVYFGANTSYDPRSANLDGNAVKIFDSLLPVLGPDASGFTVFCDRWYTTKVLIDYSLKQRFYLTATVQANRKGFPPALKGLKLKHMEQRYWLTEDQTTMVCAFQDKKAKKHVIMASTDASNDSVTVKAGLGTREKPSMVTTYNNYMNGCDRADQAIGYYGIHNRKSRKWWKKVFFWALEITQNNAYILFKMTRDRPLTKRDEANLSLKNFKKALVNQLEAKAAGLEDTFETPRKPVGRPPTLSPIQRAVPGMHLIEYAGQDRMCKVCKRRSSYVCGSCPHKPHLHPKECFRKFHKP